MDEVYDEAFFRAETPPKSEWARECARKARKEWRKNPVRGCYARPMVLPDGTTDILNWEGAISGTVGSLYEGGVFKLTIEFEPTYPRSPPKFVFRPPLYHPNVEPSGLVCVRSLLRVGWQSTYTVRDIFLDIQAHMLAPRLCYSVQLEAAQLLSESKICYEEKVRREAQKMNPDYPQIVWSNISDEDEDSNSISSC